MVPGRPTSASADSDLLAALSGVQSGRERVVACQTRRVVMASAGVIKQQRAGRTRARAVALAATLVVVLVLGPLVGWVFENQLAGEHVTELPGQISFWVLFFCSALLGAALVAGWLRNRS